MLEMTPVFQLEMGLKSVSVLEWGQVPYRYLLTV